MTAAQLQVLALNNYGHFTSMRVEDGRVRGLSLHLDRLSRDARRVFDAAIDSERVLSYIRHALRDQPGPIIVRVTLFDPELELGHPGADAQPHVLVTTRLAPLLPATPLRVQLTHYVRESPAIKHVGLFGTIQHRRTAQRAGFDDVVFLNPDRTVSEGATWNIGLVGEGGVRWPGAPALPGVTMALLQRAVTVPSVTDTITLADLAPAQAVFATNASVGVRPITLIGDETGATLYTGPASHPTLDALTAAYATTDTEEL